VTAPSSPAAYACATADVARFSEAFRVTSASSRLELPTRIHPIRSPPHNSLDTDPTAITQGLSEASGKAVNAPPDSDKSASAMSSITTIRSASATDANACRRTPDMTSPVGLCPSGITKAQDPPGARATSTAVVPAPSPGTTPRRDPKAPVNPGYVGHEASTRGGRSTRPSSHSASWAPAQMTIWSAAVGSRPNRVRCDATAIRNDNSPCGSSPFPSSEASAGSSEGGRCRTSPGHDTDRSMTGRSPASRRSSSSVTAPDPPDARTEVAHDGAPTTYVPAPTRRRSTPAATRCSKHATTVPRDTPTTMAS